MPVDPDPGGRLLTGRALVIVIIAIALGGVLQLASYLLAKDTSVTQDTLIRADMVMTLSFYAVVAVLIVSQITPNVRLRWGDGPLAVRIGIGAMVGLGLGGVLLMIVSAAAGHLQSDPRIVLLMSEGDPTHILVMVLISCIAAPLVEETLFRGLLLESLRPHGAATAVIVSAIFFAVWHFLPASLPYYIAMGAGFGRLYLKRGMASSMAAHACFNGVLSVAAIFLVLGPSHTYDVAGLSVKVPGGWTQQNSQADTPAEGVLLLEGPDGSAFFLNAIDTPTPFDPVVAAAKLQASQLPLPSNASIDQGTVREIQLPTVGPAVQADVAVAANKGTLTLFASGGRDYVVVFINGGSSKAESDFTKMLDSLRPD